MNSNTPVKIPDFIKTHGMLLASIYMTALVVVVGVFWYVLLVGGSPFTVRSIAAVDAQGNVRTAFQRGDLVGIRRVVCSKQDTDAQFRMSIKSDLGLVVPLFGVVSHMKEGCHQYGYGFVMPPLPAGTYTFSSTVIFQANLIGRDEYSEFEPITIEVLP